MSLKRWLKHRANGLLHQFGQELVAKNAVYDWQRDLPVGPRWQDCKLTVEDVSYLKPDNPRLRDLQRRYAECDPDVIKPSTWSDGHVRTEDITYFRGDNAWVWQVRGKGRNTLECAVTYYYLKSLDRLGLFDKLTEDESFGNFPFLIDGRLVSRDLLDSVAEIDFLNRHLGIGSRKNFRVLDIGAGYGRLAHRMVSALDGVERYYCTDAVAVSTFVSEYYLRFRRAEKAVVVPLDEIGATLRENPVDLAINVHSFPECRLQAIEWWIRLISSHGVKNLMIVPNRLHGGGERLVTNDGEDFLPILERYGYRTIVKEPKYLDPVVQMFGVQPTWHHLLELRG
jgi:SAM-dependent methyltransferase